MSSIVDYSTVFMYCTVAFLEERDMSRRFFFKKVGQTEHAPHISYALFDLIIVLFDSRPDMRYHGEI